MRQHQPGRPGADDSDLGALLALGHWPFRSGLRGVVSTTQAGSRILCAVMPSLAPGIQALFPDEDVDGRYNRRSCASCDAPCPVLTSGYPSAAARSAMRASGSSMPTGRPAALA